MLEVLSSDIIFDILFQKLSAPAAQETQSDEDPGAWVYILPKNPYLSPAANLKILIVPQSEWAIALENAMSMCRDVA